MPVREVFLGNRRFAEMVRRTEGPPLVLEHRCGHRLRRRRRDGLHGLLIPQSPVEGRLLRNADLLGPRGGTRRSSSGMRGDDDGALARGTIPGARCDSLGMRAVQAQGDPELLAALAGGDLAAMRTLYDRHAPWLAARLTRRCNSPDAVDDVLQDTFVALWQGAERWRGDGEVAAWLWGIAVHRLVSRLRGRREALVLPLEDVAAARPVEPSAEELVLLGVEYGDLGTALRRLSPEMRAVVQATVLDGLSTRQAARLLGIPANTVKTRLHRAKAHLRNELAGGLA
jgi:RNA polymerase sigma factor (sigma-70 family)